MRNERQIGRAEESGRDTFVQNADDAMRRLIVGRETFLFGGYRSFNWRMDRVVDHSRGPSELGI